VPLYYAFGALSDRIGRKPVMLFGMVLTCIAIFPGFHMITRVGNPALDEANTRAPVVVVADPAECNLQFDPVGKTQFRTSCDLAKSTLTSSGVSYKNQAAPAGSLAEVRIGETVIPSADGRALDTKGLAALKTEVSGRIKAALVEAGYPAKADPARTNPVGLFLVLLVFCIGATALCNGASVSTDPNTTAVNSRQSCGGADPQANINAAIRSREAAQAVTIPKESLRRENGVQGVFVVVGNALQWRAVKIGVTNITHAQVTEGVAAGDRVVLATDIVLKPGMVVGAVAE
jgi:hypothetical protein